MQVRSWMVGGHSLVSPDHDPRQSGQNMPEATAFSCVDMGTAMAPNERFFLLSFDVFLCSIIPAPAIQPTASLMLSLGATFKGEICSLQCSVFHPIIDHGSGLC